MNPGEIWNVDLSPTKGRELHGFRPVLILTPKAFNDVTPPMVAPISTRGGFARRKGFVVPLAGTKTTGAILCHQVRVLDLVQRNARLFETVPLAVLNAALGKVAAILFGDER